ncbi:hypothetical protein [Epilithonimonas hispanica]|uniref:hypothetical protein n=1 Tax=Epilithonimonas hispanica TaxID=358687 RepID=UPI001390049D|nr:hypothetical protein [Epilithonimonas hispanica]
MKKPRIFLKHKNDLGVGKCLMNIAIIQEQLGDNFGSQEKSISALTFFDENKV